MGLIASRERLVEIVDPARYRRGWGRQAQSWCDEAYVALPTLRRFWACKPIREDNFRQICAAVGVDWEQVVDWERSSRNPVDNSVMAQIVLEEDCNDMPDVHHFFGRNQELEDLKQSILQNRSRVVTLWGLAGIGKTTLAAKLTEEVKSDFKYFSWRSLNYSAAPPLSKLLSGLIEVLSSEENANLPSNVDDLIVKLLDIFATHRVLLVLDGCENISRIQGGEAFRTDYEQYGKLLRLLAELNHKSCIIITTQEEPKELYLHTDTPRAKLIKLQGLDFEASLKILEAKQLKFTPQQADNLINKDYNGNPLALFHICEHIKRLFAGSVTKFENEHTFLVPLSVETAINENCRRLSHLEAEILKIIAKESAPINYEKLKSQIQNSFEISKSDFQKNLLLLSMCSLIEISSQGNDILFGLQHIVRKCIKKFYRIN